MRQLDLLQNLRSLVLVKNMLAVEGRKRMVLVIAKVNCVGHDLLLLFDARVIISDRVFDRVNFTCGKV